jgi:predicted NAD/FAD-binding protein
MQNNDPEADLCVTYWMNLLQNIDPAKPLFVTLNPPTPPRQDLTFARFSYAHPQYDTGALAAQQRLPDIQGRNRAWFCGAWTAHGFHEDGLKSGLAVAEALGASVSWRRTPSEILQAAE